MDSNDKNKKKALLASLIVVLFGLSLYVVRQTLHRGSYEFQNVAVTPPVTDRAIPVAPGPATPGPDAINPETAEQSTSGVPINVNGGAQPQPNSPGSAGGNRQLAAVAPGGGIASGPHGMNADATGSPATGGAAINGSTAESAAKTEIQKAPEPTCFTFTYTHKATPGHDSEEACSHHKNLIHLFPNDIAHKDVNPASICVRVNGKPVHFTSAKGKSDDIVIGAVAGPHATITASYCTGKVKCAQVCKVPKDEFLDAIGGSVTEGDDGLAMGQWQQAEGEQDKAQNVKDAKLVANMKKELNGIDGQDGTGDGYTLFQGWIADPGTPSCGDKAAQAEAGTQVADLSARRKKGE